MTGLQRTDRPVWTSTDAREFTVEAEAVEHQVGLDVRPEAERYVATLDTLESERARTSEVNRIVRWEQWKAANGAAEQAELSEGQQRVADAIA